MSLAVAPAETPEVPRHVAIIMDGNGRWASARGLPRSAGHRRGVEAVRDVVRGAGELGISYLTLFGFSTENWKRPRDEVDFLMNLLRVYMRNELETLAREGARLRVVGDRRRLPADITSLIVDAEARTLANARINVTIALDYGGRADIVEAARRLADAARRGQLDPGSIDETVFASQLLTAERWAAYSPAMRDAVLSAFMTGEAQTASMLEAIAGQLGENVLVPIGTTCCGTAGDRGLLHPELVVSATRDERAALDEQPADRYVSANRTCEMGMRQATGKPYESFVFLAEELTRPANHLQSAGRRG